MDTPTKEQLINSKNKKVPDIIKINLKILFCGINPGLYSAYTGHHFARPGNRFWKALFLSGLTDRIYNPREDTQLPKIGIGITNLVERSSNSAEELTKKELELGSKVLEQKVQKYQPKVVAFLGIGAYKLAFNKKNISLGLQKDKIGNSQVLVLPNPSGLNVNFSVEDLGKIYHQLKTYI